MGYLRGSVITAVRVMINVEARCKLRELNVGESSSAYLNSGDRCITL